MMERLNSFKQNVQSLNALLSSSGGAQIQKMYSTVYALCLVLRFPGESHRLWIGRGGAVEGVLFPGPECMSAYREKDRFLELQRKMLKGCKLIEASYEENGHLVLKARSRDIDVWSIYTWSSGKLYFSIVEKGSDGVKSLSPWRNQKWHREVEGGVESVMKLHIDELVPHIRNPINEENIIPSGGKLKKVVNKKRKFLKRKRDNIKKDLEKVMLADEIQDWAISIEDEHLPNREVYFKGVKIKLDEAENFYQKRDLIFKKAKSFRAAQGILIKRLEDVSSEFEVLKDDSSVLEIVGQGLKSSLRPTSPAWPQVEAVERKKVSAGVLEGAALYEGTNIKVAIGQSAQANDGLRIKWAKKDDLWFHLEDQTSAHGFLKAEIDTPLTPKLFEVLGSALREHSKTKSDQIDLIYTKVRYLKSIKGKPGLVKFKNEKRIRVDYCEDWKEILANL